MKQKRLGKDSCTKAKTNQNERNETKKFRRDSNQRVINKCPYQSRTDLPNFAVG